MAQQTTAVIRWVVVVAALVAAAAHLPGIQHHLAEAPYMGVLFVGFTAACGSIAALATVRPTRTVFVSAACLCSAAVLTYSATRLVAFPQLAHDVGYWTEPLGVVSVLAELITVTAALELLRRHRAPVPTSAVRRTTSRPAHEGAPT